MASKTRIHPAQQLALAPSIGEPFILISDPSDSGKYKHIPVSAIVKPVKVSTVTDTIVLDDLALNIKNFTAVAPSAFYEPIMVISSLNGSFNSGTVGSISNGIVAGEFIIPISEFSDYALLDDRMDLMIVWAFNQMNFIASALVDNTSFLTDGIGVLITQ